MEDRNLPGLINCSGVMRKENTEMAGGKPSVEQDTFGQIQQLFEDLRKVKVKIEDHLLTASDVSSSKNTNEVKQKLEEIKAEYYILSNIEKGYRDVKKLQEKEESNDTGYKSEIILENSSYDSNMMNLSLTNLNSELQMDRPKSTLVYQLKTETDVLIEGYKPEELGLTMSSSKVKLKKTKSEEVKETTKKQRKDSQYQTETTYKKNTALRNSEDKEMMFNRSFSDSGNFVHLETENKNLKKQIINIQEDLQSIKSDLLEINDHAESPQERKEQRHHSKFKGKIGRLKRSKGEPKNKNKNHPPDPYNSTSHRVAMSHKTRQKAKTINEDYYSTDDELDNPVYVAEKPISNSDLQKRDVGLVKHSVVKTLDIKKDNKSILSIVSNDFTHASKLDLALRRSSTPDSLKKKMHIKEKEIQSLKNALKAAEKSNYKEADRLRTAKLSDDISEKLLHKSHECDKLLEENIKLRKTIDEMGIEIRDLELANLQLKNVNDSLEITKEKNTEENAELMNRVQFLQDEIEKCHGMTDLKEQISGNLARVMSELNECKNENKEQKNKLNSLIKDKDSKIYDLEKKIESLTSENQENKSKRKEVEDKNKSLEKKIDEIKRIYKRKLSDQTDRLKMAETKAIRLQRKIPSIDSQREIEDLKRDNQILTEDVKRLKEQNSTLQYENVEIAKQKERCEKVLNTIANENDSLKNERMHNDCACRDLENELALLKSEKIRLENILSSTNGRAIEMNENKNQLINSLNELEQQKASLLQDLDIANQELVRLREENYQLDLKYQQMVLDSRPKCLKDEDSNVLGRTEEPSAHSATVTSKPCSGPANSPGTLNVRGYEFSITSGVRRGKFHGQSQNKPIVEATPQVFAVAVPETDGRPKGECKKRLPPRKKC